ncbi:MAG TPA: 2'-5' RNA ligase family protein [Segetibacter sp.]|jgi:2'-5' RNA ligase
MNFFIGIVPPTVISEDIFYIQNQFGNNRLEPHITLRPPVALKDEAKWIEVVEEFCKSFPPFTIDLTGTGNFGKRVLFIKLRSPELLKLEEQLVNAIKPYEQESQKTDDRKGYHPHLTLGRSWCGFTKEDFSQMKILADEYLAKEPVSFDVDFLRIYHKPKSNEGYKTLKDVTLGA